MSEVEDHFAGWEHRAVSSGFGHETYQCALTLSRSVSRAFSGRACLVALAI